MFHGYLKDVSRMFQACFEELTRIWNASKELERKFQKFSTEVSMLFQGININMSKVIQSSLEGVSRKFCFLILLLHGTHRSYLSRVSFLFLFSLSLS